MNNFTKLLKSSAVGVTSSVLIFGAGSALAAGKLNVTNWDEYIAEDTISNFAAEYDIEVIYDVYDSVEAIDSKLLAGSTGYDVVSHSMSSIARLIPAGILQPFDKSKLSNMGNMRADVMAQVANSDEGNNYIVPFMFGTHGVTYNSEMVKAAYPDAPFGSLDLIFDPSHISKIAGCGVALLDSPGDIIPMALAYMGLDPNSTNKEDYVAVEEMLLKIRPYIKTFDNYAYQRLPEKEFCVTVTWGPDGLLAMSQAEDAGVVDVQLDFYLPPGQNGAQFWVDGWVIPADAENVENAHLFLDYMMRAQVAANDSNYTWYASANAAAFDLIDPAVTGSPAAYPRAEDVAKMYTVSVLPPKIEKAQTRAWTNFKAGN